MFQKLPKPEKKWETFSQIVLGSGHDAYLVRSPQVAVQRRNLVHQRNWRTELVNQRHRGFRRLVDRERVTIVHILDAKTEQILRVQHFGRRTTVHTMSGTHNGRKLLGPNPDISKNSHETTLIHGNRISHCNKNIHSIRQRYKNTYDSLIAPVAIEVK